jgi:hypothetical protein
MISGIQYPIIGAGSIELGITPTEYYGILHHAHGLILTKCYDGNGVNSDTGEGELHMG